MALFAVCFVALAVVFAVLERVQPRHRQRVLSRQYVSDLLHVVLSNSAPATLVEFAGYAVLAALSPRFSLALMNAQPVWVQVAVILVLTELTFYFVHRAMHRVPQLWRLHEMHHTSADMDWLSGYRKHALETVVHAGVALVPIALIGFSSLAWLSFGLLGVFFAGFTHLNIKSELRWLEWLVVTPRYHAWHHATDLAEQQRNFAGKFTILDSVFGTRRADTAAAWPAQLGLDTAAATKWWPTAIPKTWWRGDRLCTQASSEELAGESK